MAGREKRKRRKHRERKRQRPGTGIAETEVRSADVEAVERAVESRRPPGDQGVVEARKSKDDLAREQLVPLEEGERPVAVTIGAVVAALLVLGWIVALIAGRSNVAGAAPLTLLLAVAAWGMWHARYWAVLGFQVLLAITLVNAILFLVLRADAVLDVVVGLTVVAAAGTLFWFLIRALARIQMPQRRVPN
jgi:hypothetical protein